MVNLKRISCGIAILSVWAIPLLASSPYSQNVYLVKTSLYGDSNFGPEGPEDTNPGRRLPQKRIQCTIDPESGIEFLSSETPLLISYELYDTDGNLLNSFSCEEDFVETLFSLSGEYRILLNDIDFSYTGHISL